MRGRLPVAVAAAVWLVDCAAPRPVLQIDVDSQRAVSGDTSVQVDACTEQAREQRAGWLREVGVYLVTGALVGGALGASSFASSSVGRDDIGTRTAGGAVAGSVIGVGSGFWLMSRERRANLRSGIAKCLEERGYQVRRWE